MTIPNGRRLRSESRSILARFPHQKKLALLWAGLYAAISLALLLLTAALDSGIAGTGGLSGMGLRSVLSTVQVALSTGVSIAVPFWGFGHVYAMLRLSRGKSASNADLLEGFRRFGPGVRLLLLEGLLYGALFLVCMNVGFSILSLTPLAEPLVEVLTPMMDSIATNPELIMDEAVMASIVDASTGMILGCMVIYAVALTLIGYRLRLAQFRLMDDPACGAMEAIRTSTRYMRHNCMALFRLDLGFWWFYLAEVLVAALSYGNLALPYLGISLSPAASYLLFGGLSLGLQFAVYWLGRNKVYLTYALAYESLLPPPQPPVPPHPWSN